MASHQTTNFQLCQWEAEDEVLRTDFNADNLKIENALSAVKAVTDVAYTTENAPVAFGWYAGDGTEKRKIEVGFDPRAALVVPADGEMTAKSNYMSQYGGLAVEGCNASIDQTGQTAWVGGRPAVALSTGGFYVSAQSDGHHVWTNRSGITYCYLAFR